MKISSRSRLEIRNWKLGKDETSLRAGYLQHGRKVINYGVANYNSSSDGEVEFLT